MRVLYVENSYGEMGGSLVSLLQLTRKLVEQGRSLPSAERIEPCFYFLYPNLLLDEFRELGEVALERKDYEEYGSLIGLPRALSVTLGRLPGPARKALGEIFPLARRVAHHARRFQADLLHSNSRLGSNEYAILGGLLARIPVVAHERLLYRVSALTRPFAASADLVIAISEAVAESLAAQGVRTRRLEVVPNGIDTSELSRYRDRPKDLEAPFRVGMVGRITRWKGQHVFIDAARRVTEQITNIEFHLAGDAPPTDASYLRALMDTVKDVDLEKRVIFHGNVKGIYDFISKMDVLVHCSVEPEPLGRVILEAMALRKPTIATRGGAVEEICTNNHDALVVDPGRPDQLADAITRLHGEPAAAAALARNALHTIETRFSLDRAAHRVQTLYEEMALVRRPRSVLDRVTEFLASSPFSVRRAKPAQIARKAN